MFYLRSLILFFIIAHNSWAVITFPSRDYNYDGLSNREEKTVLENSQTKVATFQYDADKQLTASSDNSVQNSYDANGNVITQSIEGVIQHFVYNASDQLVAIKVPSADPQTLITKASYSYDVLGRRIRKTLFDTAGVKTDDRYFHYNIFGLAGEYDSSGNELRQYGYWLGSSESANLLFVKESDKYYYSINDHRGAPQFLIEESGRIVWAGISNSAGEVKINVEEINCNHRLPGQYFDEETNLHYNRYRYYQPFTGRYLQVDPILDGSNHYLYAGANPMSFIDPYGLAAADLTDSSSLKLLAAVANGSDWSDAISEHGVEAATELILTAAPLPGLNKTRKALKKVSKKADNLIDKALKKADVCTNRWGNCFLPGTMVVTREGLKAIETIQQGEEVLSRDEKTGEMLWSKVEDTFKREEIQEVFDLTIRHSDGSESTYGATAEHPFYVENRGWLPVYVLQAGDKLIEAKGETAEVVSLINRRKEQGFFTVYNLTVSSTHSYFVFNGDDLDLNKAIWTHNAKKDYVTSNFKKDDNIGLERFTKPGKNGSKIDPKTKQVLEKTQGNPHGKGADFKLKDKSGKRIGTVSNDGRWLRK